MRNPLNSDKSQNSLDVNPGTIIRYNRRNLLRKTLSTCPSILFLLFFSLGCVALFGLGFANVLRILVIVTIAAKANDTRCIFGLCLKYAAIACWKAGDNSTVIAFVWVKNHMKRRSGFPRTSFLVLEGESAILC